MLISVTLERMSMCFLIMYSECAQQKQISVDQSVHWEVWAGMRNLWRHADEANVCEEAVLVGLLGKKEGWTVCNSHGHARTDLNCLASC